MSLSSFRVAGIASLAVSMLAFAGPAAAQVNPTPSTNDANRTLGWAHVNEVGGGPGYIDLEFPTTRGFASCFEYRSDGAPTTDPRPNFNTAITDGLWPFVCVTDSTQARTLNAIGYVEVRMVFGAERDERFDWTRFDVTPPPPKYSCVGFEPPADDNLFVKKPNRVLPLRMSLEDGDGMAVWDIAPPVVNVSYKANAGSTPEIIDELTFAGRGDEGNRFLFDGSKWAFNISLKAMAKGEYTISAVPGGEYLIDPTCEVVVTIQ